MSAQTSIEVPTTHTEESLTKAILQTWGGIPSQGGGVRYVVAIQVNNGAGFSFGRTLDAIVFDTWPSKGLTLHGLEVKVSRADLRRELQDPDKAAAFTEHLDIFSIVAPKDVVDRDIIPRRWGIYMPDGKGGLRAARKPLYLHDDARDRRRVDRDIMAAFSRALVQRSLSREAEQLAYDRGHKAAERIAAFEIDRTKNDAARCRERIAEFEQASGVSIDQYNAGDVGKAFAAFRRLSGTGYEAGLPIDQARRVAERVEGLADDMAALKSYLNGDA